MICAKGSTSASFRIIYKMNCYPDNVLADSYTLSDSLVQQAYRNGRLVSRWVKHATHEIALRTMNDRRVVVKKGEMIRALAPLF